ncbi:MAG: hypothetical protein QM710_14925 [Flavobacterium sp.]
MPTTFDFTYTLSPESAQNETLNALAKGRIKPPEPKSYFFTESTVAAQASSTGAYGPENGNSITKFNITTIFPLTDKKAYAVTSGQVLIVPQSADKVNVFIKPLKNIDIGIPIKYFVYRGLKKELFIKTDNTILNYSETALTPFMKKVWKDLIAFNGWTTPPATSTPPIPATLFGFNATEPADTRIDSKFFNVYADDETDTNKVYNLPIVEAGQYFGEFVDDEGGFEIVLNDGFYYQEKSDTGFEFDMTYARASKMVLDIANISTDPDISEKIYRENVQKFLDPAAFYGAHITEKEKGEIKVIDNSAKYSSKNDIYNNIISKFYNKHKVYLYIQSNRARSYDFDGSIGNDPMKIGLPGNLSPALYETNSWPIIIREDQQTHTNSQLADKGFNDLTFQLKFKTVNKNATLYCSHGNLANEDIDGCFLDKNALLNEADIATQEYTNNINCKLSSTYNIQNSSLTTNSISTFIYINQIEDEIDYFNDFFGPIRIENITKKNSGYPSKVASKVKNNNLKIIKRGKDSSVSYQIHTQIPQSDSQGTPVDDPYRLYILKRFDSNNPDFSISSDSRTFTQFTSDNSYRGIINNEEYGDFQYGSKDYRVWKGKMLDGVEVINTLQLINFEAEGNVPNYIHLGLMGDDYKKVIYNSLTSTSTNHIPDPDANVFFHLEPDPNASQISLLKKYKLGVKVESFGLLGVSHSIIFPSAANEVNVYTMDGHYFFTKDFSEKFQFTEEMADANINFKPRTGYEGKFGFDWMRLYESSTGKPGYMECIANGYSEPRWVWNPLPSREYGFEAPTESNAFTALRKEYINIVNQQNSIFYVPFINIYPNSALTTLVGNYPNDTPPPVVANLTGVLTNHENITKLSLDYDSKYFNVSAQFPSTFPQGDSSPFNVQISCLEEFDTDKYIKIMSHSQEPNELPKVRLAGIVKVRKNSYQHRQSVKIALFKVKTHVDQANANVEQGSFMPEEVKALKQILFQSNIYADIVGPIDLDLTADSKFWKNHDYINNDGKIYPKYPVSGDSDEKQDYLRDKIPAAYKNHFRIYAFDLGTTNDTVGAITEGNIQHIGKHSACLYAGNFPRDPYSLAHEACHGMGLRHTHQDGVDIDDPNQKFIFPYGGPPPAPGGPNAAPADVSKSTDNVMSYNTSLTVTHGPWYTWNWQWKIMHDNLKNYTDE